MLHNKPSKLCRNFSWTFIGNAVYAACQWGMLMVLAKLGSPTMVGQFTLGLAVTAPIVMFTNLQLRSVQVTDAKKQYCFSDYLGLRLISTSLALLLIGIISFSGAYRWETSVVIFLVGVAKAIESISDLFYGLIQQHESIERIAFSLMMKGPLSLLLLGVGVYTSGSIIWGIMGLVLAWAAMLFCYDIPHGALLLNHRLQMEPRWHLPTLLKLVWLCLPLGLVMMLISLNSNIPRYFIEGYLGEEELGIFAAIAYLMVAGGMVVSALGESSISRLAKYYSAQNVRSFWILLLQLVGIAALLGGTGILVALLAGREILSLIYKPEYGEQTNLFVWLMVAGGIGYISSFLGYGMTAARYFFIQIPLFMTVAIISPIACWLLLPKLGLLGGVLALIIANTVQALMSGGVIIYSLHNFQSRSQI